MRDIHFNALLHAPADEVALRLEAIAIGDLEPQHVHAALINLAKQVDRLQMSPVILRSRLVSVMWDCPACHATTRNQWPVRELDGHPVGLDCGNCGASSDVRFDPEPGIPGSWVGKAELV